MAHATMARRGAALLLCILAASGCGLSASANGPVVAGAVTTQASAPATSAPSTSMAPSPNHAPDSGRAKNQQAPEEAVSPWDLPSGALYVNPASGRKEIIDPAIARSAVLIGDSQSGGASGVKASDTWVGLGLAARGYKVSMIAVGGTGFVSNTSAWPNYPDAVESGKAVLPFGNPALVVVQGGGNDASRGVPDAEILTNAARLLKDLKVTYPRSKILFIGTLAKGSADGGGRRTQVDTLLAGFAHSNGLNFVSAGDWVTRYGVSGKMADGVHLTGEGHKVLAGVLSDKLKSMGLNGPAAK